MRRFLYLILLTLITGRIFSQPVPLNIHRITPKDGLNDMVATSVGQDKYGNIWITTLSAVHRYNGREIKRFYHVSGDSTSSLSGTPTVLCRDSSGIMWIGYNNGLAWFDDKTETFHPAKAAQGLFVFDIAASSNHKLYLFTSDAILCYNPKTEQMEPMTDGTNNVTDSTVNEQYLADYIFDNEKYYLSAEKEIWCYDVKKREYSVIQTPMIQGEINRIRVDATGHLWLSDYEYHKLVRINPDGSNPQFFDTLLTAREGRPLLTANDMFSDADGNFWISTTPSGMYKYDPKNNNFEFYGYNNHIPINLGYRMSGSMFLSKEGLMWMVSFTGVDYFHPKKNIFSSHKPHTKNELGAYARTATEDHDGNLWFSTMDGIARFDRKTGTTKTWIKEYGAPSTLPFNSSRMIAVDAKNHLWFTSGAGLITMDPSTEKFTLLKEEDGFPYKSYYHVMVTRNGTIWFGGRADVGLRFLLPGETKAHSVSEHPVLKAYSGWGIRKVFEDSKGRLWIGFDLNGLAVYDPATGMTKQWDDNAGKKNTVAGNKVIDIKEDSKGQIWVSAYNGVSCLNPTTFTFTNFMVENGMPSSNCNSIIIDKKDRAWIGTSVGLVLIEPDLKTMHIFDENDGLISSGFMEHEGTLTSDGIAYMATKEGFVTFDPLQYQEENNALNCYVTSYSVLGKTNLLSPEKGANTTLTLSEHENFFTLHLSAPNYINADQTWYAYKLEGFDNDWVYTQYPEVQYTNVPGGEYTFRFKASTDRNKWNVPEQTIEIEVVLPIYKQWWFKTLAAILVALVFFAIFRYRANREREIAELNSRAQLLEKEKSVVQYENLKQQLNPHFLFNSLTSLGVLINSDQKLARQFVDQMSKIYRYILKSSDNETVPLSNELNFAKSYIHLQKTRFGDGFIVNINTDEELEQRAIVPVTIQNMLENAIKHNIIDAESPLIVDITTEDDYIIISNNVQRKNVVESSNKKGLSQLKALYRFLSDKPILIEESNERYTIKIPLI